MGGPAPVPFIVGLGRSGNTLLRMMLDAHPDLAIPPETDFIPEAAARCAGAEDPRGEFLRVVTGHWRFDDLGIDASELGRRVARIEPFDAGAGLRAVYGLYAEKFGKPRFGDKTPFYLDHMPLIERLMPETRFVHMIRDGRDVAVSIRPLWFGPSSVRKAAGWWRDGIEQARAAGSGLGHYLELRFEDLVIDTEPALKRVCEFIELPWDPAMLAYHERAPERIREVRREGRGSRGELIATVEQRHAIHETTAMPPQHDRIGRWRTELGWWELRWFESVAGDLLAELGYPGRRDAPLIV
jgi:hypothetical protein